MSDDPTARAIAADWRPQRPGRRAPRGIVDPLVEPDWAGIRVVAAVTVDSAVFVRNGDEIDVPDELPEALVKAFGAVEAVVEGHLTTAALRSSMGALPATPAVERPPLLVPRGLFKSAKNDPYIKAREQEIRDSREAVATLESLAAGERHAFVATDLLWLDGTALFDIPLLERKRLLDGLLTPSELVRITPFVQGSANTIMGTWGTLGFDDISYRAANSRYLPGQENPDWAMVPALQGSGGPARASSASR